MRKYNEISRRGFLRSAVLAGTGICASSVFNGMVACEGVNRQGPSALDCKTNAVVGVKPVSYTHLTLPTTSRV